MENQTDLLQPEITSKFKRRRQLLPWWIKIFIWIFFIIGLSVPLAFVFGIIGHEFQLALYGFFTNEPLSLTGLFLIAVFALKGLAAFGLWFEKKWAINVGLIDALLGLIICLFLMFIYPLIDSSKTFIFPIKIEIFFLFPYLRMLLKIRKDWSLFSEII
jgi:hypothetical protein